MINLIPNEDKKHKVQHFYARLLVVTALALGASFLTAALALAPAYIISRAERQDILAILEVETSASLGEESGEGALSEMKDLNAKLELLAKTGKNKYVVSDNVFQEIILAKMTDIQITEITYENETKTGKKVSLRGNAASRERLLLFRRALENNPKFKKVDLPISNFVKGADIQFNLNLIPS